MMTVNTTHNIKTSLVTMTLAQLKKELKQANDLYQGAQVVSLPEVELDRWNTYIELIEDEIIRRRV